MRVYSVIDYRYYPMLNNFVYLYPETKKNQYQNVKIDYYFKSFLNDLAWKYRMLSDKVNISILKTFYDGRLIGIQGIINHLPINKDYPITDDRFFDYDELIYRLNSRLETILVSAEDEIRDNYFNSIQKLGKYFSYREVIKVCYLYKERLEKLYE